MQQRGGEIMNNPEYLEFEGRDGLTSCNDSTEGTLTCGCSNLRTWKSVHVPDFFHTEGRKCSQERDKGSESPDDWSPPSLKNRPISDLKCAEADTVYLHVSCVYWVWNLQFSGAVKRWVRVMSYHSSSAECTGVSPTETSVLPLPVSISFFTSNDIMTNPSLAEDWLLCSHSSVCPSFIENKEGVDFFQREIFF